MAIQEVVDWSTETKGNQAVHPTSPEGQRAVRISSSFQELQAAIARWRDSLGSGSAIGGSITDNQIAVGAATANEIEGNASFTFDASTNELRLGTQVTGRIEMGGTAESIRWNNTLDTIDIYQDSQIVIGISGTQDVAMPWGNLRVGGTSAVNGVVSVRSSAATDALVDFYNGTTKYAELRLDNANLDLDIRTQVAGAEVAVYSGLGFEAMRWHGTNGDTAMGGYFTQYNGGTPTDTHVLTWVTANGRAEFIAGIPAGMVADFAQATAPTGWLECDGSSVSRTTYADLFTAIGVTYGNVDANTFNLPDYRGEFRRSWDHGAGVDPDAASRTNRGDGTTGDNVGTKQAEDIGPHTHTFPVYATNASTGNQVKMGQPGASGEETTSDGGGTETRPINTNVLTCIKY